MTRRMVCMRRTLMHGSRCAAASSGAVGRQPHGASRWGRGRTCMRAECSVQPIAFRVQRQPQLIGSRPREQTCNGALRARGGVQQTGKRARHRGQDGALASRVAPCARVLGRRGGSIRTGITWKVESATTAQGPSCSSAVTPHPAHSAGTPAASAACSSTARINAAVDAPTSPSACTAAVDALASRRCHGFGLRVGCPRLFAHTVAILENLGKTRE